MHVDPGHLQEVVNILRKYLSDYEVWAFGSRVHGRHLKPFSDLDLVVITTSPLDPLHLADIKDAFTESDLPFKVDLLDWARVNDRFRRIIAQEHVVVKERS